MNTLEQKMAKQIYEQIRQQEKGTTRANEYGAMAHRLPVLIRQAGLVQALAYVAARGKPGAKQLLTDLAQVLGYQGNGAQAYQALLDASRTADLLEYMHLTHKATMALTWYKRFAQSVLDVDVTADVTAEEDGT